MGTAARAHPVRGTTTTVMIRHLIMAPITAPVAKCSIYKKGRPRGRRPFYLQVIPINYRVAISITKRYFTSPLSIRS